VAAVIRYALAAAADIVKLTPEPPAVEVDNVPSVAAKVTGPSGLDATRLPPAELCPLVNVIVVAVPKFTAAPVLLVTVGTVPSGAAKVPGPSALYATRLPPAEL